MLESLYITKSKIRQDILTLFFTNSSQKYYLRELQRILGYSAGSIRRELLKFQKDNLFNTQKVYKKKRTSVFLSGSPQFELFRLAPHRGQR